jgi:hypothetical protein
MIGKQDRLSATGTAGETEASQSSQTTSSWLEFSRLIRTTTALTFAGGLLAVTAPAIAAPNTQTQNNGDIVLEVHDTTFGDAQDGVIATTTGGNTGTNNITISNTGAALTITPGPIAGINANVTSPTTDGVITVTGPGAINIVSTGNTGITATNLGTGAISINTGGGTINGLTGGLNLTASGGGAITVTNIGAVAGNTGTGIAAAATGGNGSVSISPFATVSGTNGVTASAVGTGNVTITTAVGAGGNITGTAGFGVQTSVADGINTVTNNATTISGTTSAVDATGTGTGIVSVTGAGTYAGGTAAGIRATLNGANAAASDGIAISGTGATTATTGIGIDANITNAANATNINITRSGAVTVGAGGGNGINATTAGAGNVSVTGSGAVTAGTGAGTVGINATAAGGNVIVTPGSTVTGATGINASTTGAGTVGVTVANAVTGTVASGITTSVGNGTGTINVNGATTVTGAGSGNAGIAATGTGTGATTITVAAAGGAVTGGTTASGIRIVQSGTGSNVIVNSGTISGSGAAVDPVIYASVTNAGTTTITNNAGATIRSNNAVVADRAADLAISSPVATGAFTITNSGTLLGRIALTGNADGVTNTAGATWTLRNGGLAPATDAANFGAGVDTLTNSGTINVGDTASAAFANNLTGLETFTNTATGVLNAGQFAGSTTNVTTALVQTVTNAGTVNVINALNFTGAAGSTASNSGLINMQTAVGVTSDTTTFNVTVGTGAASNTYTPGVAYNFVGAAGSRLALNANIGTTASQGSAVPADRLLISGSATGRTAITINNTNGGLGGYNPMGITLVGVNGATSNNFFIAGLTGGGPAQLQSNRGPNGAIKSGFFFYPLLMTSGAADGIATEYRLFGMPDVEAFQLPVAMTGAQTLFFDTAVDWQARQSDLRRYAVRGGQSAGDISAAPGYYAPRGNGVWMKASGGYLSRSASQSLGNIVPVAGQLPNADTSYNQSTFSIIVGGDASMDFGGSRDGAFTFGAFAGYVNSTLNFKSSPTNFTYQGATFGVSGTYQAGGFFADLLLKADILSIGMNFPSLAPFGFGGTTAGGRNFGGIASTGYRFDQGGWYVEPSVTLAYVSTTIDGMSGLGVAASYNTGQDFRGALGAQVGVTAFEDSKSLFNVSLTGKVWDQFVSTSGIVLGGAGSGLTLNDPHAQVFGEVIAAFNYYGKDSAWSGFVNAGGKFNDQFWSLNATLGGRYRF